MIVGKKSDVRIRKLCNNRSNQAIDYAIDQIRKSKIACYMSGIFLYGSCARNEQTYESDVDLLIELQPSFRAREKRIELISELVGRLSDIDDGLPKIDIKFVIGDEWRTDEHIFYQNVRRDGIKINLADCKSKQ